MRCETTQNQYKQTKKRQCFWDEITEINKTNGKVTEH